VKSPIFKPDLCTTVQIAGTTSYNKAALTAPGSQPGLDPTASPLYARVTEHLPVDTNPEPAARR
jgi:hypothetical protein